MKRGIAISVVLLVSLAACGDRSDNKDPREGVVYLEKHNCWGECFNVTKVCLGPDLVYRDTRLTPENRERIIKDAPECEPTT